MRLPASLLLAAAGAAVLLVVVQRAGGDFGDWPQWRAIAVPVAAFVVPAALAAFAARRGGVAEALLWAVACIGLQVALLFGVGFLALGLGPD
jgi:uncharacterized membrane protein YoaK (UPF0700 family)